MYSVKNVDGPRSSGIRKKRKSRSERDRGRRSNGIRNNHVKGPVFRFSSESEREGSREPSSSRPRPPRRKRKESTSAEEDIIDGFSITGFVTLEALEKNMTLTSPERRGNKANKKKPGRVPNGLRIEACNKNNHQHEPSDQENNPRLAQTPGKRKKKRLNKKRKLKPGQNNCKGSDSESASGGSKPSIRCSSRDRLTDCDTESDQDDKVSLIPKNTRYIETLMLNKTQ